MLMMQIDQNGNVLSSRVKLAISLTIQRGPMNHVRGIIVHQTGSLTAQATLNSYKRGNPNGAHFLIDKDGTIYQTASIFKKTWHAGKLRARGIARLVSCSAQP